MRSYTFSRALYSWQEGGYPLTKWIILLNVVTWLAGLFGLPVALWLSYQAPYSLLRPWTLFTYPLVSFSPINLLFYALWLYWMGGSLERSWGTRTFATYFMALSAITALGMTAGAWLLHRDFPVFEWLPIAGLTVAWCMLNRYEEILFFGMIPMLAQWMAAIEALIIFAYYFQFHPLCGLFALSGCAASFIWVRTRAWSGIELYSTMPVSPRPARSAKARRTPRDDRFSWRDLNPIEWIVRYRRKKQFMRLWDDEHLPKD